MAKNFKVTGSEELMRKLSELSASFRAADLAVALTAAAEPIVDAAKSNAPPGDIREAIQVVGLDIKDSGTVTARVGIPGGRHKGFYGLWVELGTGPRQRKKGGSTGSMPASPFLRPAFDAHKEQAQRIFSDHLKAKLELIANG